MSIKKMVIPEKDHIIEARSYAEAIHKKKPEVQIEMLREIKAHSIKLVNVTAREIESI